MDVLIKWLLFTSVQIAATMSPGPAFAMTVRSAMAHGRRAGIYTAFGLGFGVGVHVLLVLGGLSVILMQSPLLYNLVKYAGGAYLIYTGVKALKALKHTQSENQNGDIEKSERSRPITNMQAFSSGFLTNLLNPKAVIFFTAVFTQFIGPQTAFPVMVLYGLTSVLVEIIWFCLLTLFLTDPRIRARFMAISHWIERICGGLLIGLGIRLALSKMH